MTYGNKQTGQHSQTEIGDGSASKLLLCSQSLAN